MSLRLTRQPKSPFLYADFDVWNATTQEWDRKLISTKKRTQAEAWPVAIQFASIAGAAAEAASKGWNRVDVHQMVSDILSAAGVNPSSAQMETWHTYSTRWLAARKVKPQSLRQYKLWMAAFSTFLGERVHSPLPALSVADCQAFYDARLKAGILPTTLRWQMAFLKRVFQRAVLEGIIDRNPTVLVEKSKTSVPLREPFTKEEIARLITEARTHRHGEHPHKPEWEMMIWIGLCVAARLKDCSLMSTDHLDIQQWTLTFTAGKTGKRVTVPVVEPLLSAIQGFLAEGKTGPFCPHLSTLPTRSLTSSFSRLLQKAQVGQGRRIKGQRDRCFHCLRHTLPTWMESAGVSESTKMAITGHKSVQVHRGYTHHELEGMRNALQKGLERVSASSPQSA